MGAETASDRRATWSASNVRRQDSRAVPNRLSDLENPGSQVLRSPAVESRNFHGSRPDPRRLQASEPTKVPMQPALRHQSLPSPNPNLLSTTPHVTGQPRARQPSNTLRQAKSIDRLCRRLACQSGVRLGSTGDRLTVRFLMARQPAVDALEPPPPTTQPRRPSPRRVNAKPPRRVARPTARRTPRADRLRSRRAADAAQRRMDSRFGRGPRYLLARSRRVVRTTQGGSPLADRSAERHPTRARLAR
jgi:hypothetical protein